jgi:hypothetical protein
VAVPVAAVGRFALALVGEDLEKWAVRLGILVAVVAAIPLLVPVLAFAGVLALVSGATAGRAVPGVAPGSGVPAITAPAPALPPQIGGPAFGLVPNWSAAPALNQFELRNYRSQQSWLTWRNAACSAASLSWLLYAYGVPVPFIDDAIGLIGPDTGISTSLGLLDATGAPLARAISRAGVTPRVPLDSHGRSRALSSISELKAWLDRGPVAMDGRLWFVEGHWFVGTGYDTGGIYIRDSSGYDNRYLTWSRLYGEVGFSGWIVGITAPSPN